MIQDFLVINDNIWDENQHLKIIRRIETNYSCFMRIRKNHYLNNAPSKLRTFINILDKILEFHISIIVPMLQNKETTFLTAANAIIEYIQVTFDHQPGQKLETTNSLLFFHITSGWSI